MVRLIVALWCACILSPAVAADQKELKKGDTVYVSSEFEIFIAMPLLGVNTNVLEACDAMEVKKLKLDYIKLRHFMTRQGLKLTGDFARHIHRTEKECQEAFKKHGQPLVKAFGTRVGNFEILPRDEEQPEDHREERTQSQQGGTDQRQGGR